ISLFPRSGDILAIGMLTQSTHATLLKRLSAGPDPAAWQEFCDRYGALIRGFTRRYGLQPADSDDVVQEVLTALAQSMPRFRYEPGKGRFRSYLKTVVLHAIFRRFRQNRGEVPLEEGEDVVGPGADNPETDAQWEAEWRQYHLRLAMRTIETEFNERDRAAFDAYAIRGGDARTVAASLGMSLDQVYQAKSRILRRVGELVGQQVREEG
ncbi:MAG: RNA polymerase sigma factor, partial [Phycisphaerae bacterium]